MAAVAAEATRLSEPLPKELGCPLKILSDFWKGTTPMQRQPYRTYTTSDNQQNAYASMELSSGVSEYETEAYARMELIPGVSE